MTIKIELTRTEADYLIELLEKQNCGLMPLHISDDLREASGYKTRDSHNTISEHCKVENT